MKWFKRFQKAIKTKRHDIRPAATAPYQREFYKAVRCHNCGKTFIMDAFGGWSIEWDFKMDELMGGWYRINDEDFQKALEQYRKTPVSQWISIHDVECTG